MASTAHKLDTLPSEIIKRIAACSPFESVLALLKTNRRLHQECNDHLVFKDIIENGNGLNTMPLWDISFLSGNTSASECAHFAFADSMARKFVASVRHENKTEDPNSNTQGDAYRMMHWAPQLVALHHPFITNPELHATRLDAQLKREDGWAANLEALATINFCITAKLFQYGFSNGRREILEDSAVAAGKMQQIKAYLTVYHEPETTSDPPVTAVLSCQIMQAFQQSSLLLLPCLPNIPFSSFTDFPIPFSGNPFQNPEKSYLTAMTSKSFLEDGEWMGCYNYSPRLGSGQFDPPMTGIYFTTSTLEPEDTDMAERNNGQDTGTLAAPDKNREVVQVKASGTDNVGNFTLSGEIWSSGMIDMKKTYVAPTLHSWDWAAWMTPFGMVGFWGHGQAHYGYFWLWKRAWTKQGEPQLLLSNE